MTKFFGVKKVLSIVAILSLVFLPVTPAFSADAQWNGTTNTLWDTDTNWSAAHPVTLNTATFNNAGNANTTINLGAGAAVGSILFDTLNAAAYTIGSAAGQTLTLDNGGGIVVNNGVAQTQTIQANVVLSPNASFSNNGASDNFVMNVTGDVTGGGAGTLTLNGSDTGNNTVSGIIANGAGALAVTKSEAGTWVLSGANTYSGGTTLTAGTLNINNARALGTGTVSIADGTTIDCTSGGAGITLTSTGAQTWNGNFTFTGTDDLNLGTGTVAIGAATRTVTTTAGNLTVGGVISSTGAFGLTKAGNGTLTLNGVNTYSGATAINGGVVKISAASGLGDASATNTISFNTGTLESTAGLTLVSNRAITLNGAGTLQSDAGTLTVAGTVTNGANLLTVTGAGDTTISGIIGGGAGGLTKTGAGTLTLSGVNTYSGATAINGGIVKISAASGLGDASATNTISFNTGTLESTAGLTLVANRAITLNGAGTFQSDAGTLTVAGTVTNGANLLTVTGAGDTTVSGVIGGGAGGLTKAGAGTLNLTGADTYSGATAVGAGALTLSGADGAIASSSGVTIGSGATLTLANTAAANNASRLKDTGTVAMNGGTLNFTNDAGAANFSETTGALTIGSGTNTIATSRAASGQTSALTFASLTHTAGTINFSGTGLGVDTRNQIFFTASPTFSSWATYNGTGFAAYDAILGVVEATYTDIDARGPSTIVDGSTNVRILGDGTSGNIALSAATTTISTLLQDNSTIAATVDTAGKTLRAGSIMIGSGKAALTIGTAADSGTLTVDSAGGDLMFINNSTSALTVNAIVADNAAASSLTKEGTGTLTLNGTNTYTGATAINEGTVKLGNAAGLGTTAAGTTVAATGAALDLNGQTVGAEAVTLNGTGVSSGGALLNSSDSAASLSGAITLGSASTITSAGAGGLTLTGGITNGGFDVTFAGANATTVSTAIITGTGGLTKTGAGTLTLSAANNYSGATTINAGTVKLENAAGLGTTAAGTTVSATDAALDLNGQAVGAEAITLNGAGVGGSGALYNNSTAASLSGAITLASASTISSWGTGALTLTGGINNGGVLLTIDGDQDTTVSTAIITGAGGLTKTGAGTLTLSAANDYTGATTISEGTLKLGAAGVIANTNAVTANGTLDLNGYGETIGSLAGSGTVTNSGGALGINPSTLIVGGDGTSTTFSGVIQNGAGLATVALQKKGAGTFTLSGVNTYTGTTSVYLGTLNLSEGLTTSALDFQGISTVNVAAGKSITHAVTNNSGIMVLGTLNFLGSTTVGGNIGAAGSSALAAVNFNGGTATLGYNIFATDTNINSGATLHLTGSRTITGDMTFDANSTLSLDINSASSYGNAVVTGAVTLPSTAGITVNVIDNALASGTPFTVIDGAAGSGVDGGNTVTDNSVLLSFMATTDVNNQDLILTANRSQTLGALAGENSNTSAVGTALEGARAGASGDMLNVLTTLDNMSSAQEITDSLETMMPDPSSGAMQGSRSLNSHFVTAITNRLSYARNGFTAFPDGLSTGDGVQGMGFWMQGLGSHAKQGTREGIQGYSANTFGTSIGFDKLLGKHLRMGLAGGYGFGSISSRTPGSPHTDINSFQGTIYGSYDSTNLFQARKERKYSPEAVRNQSERLWYVDGMLSFTQNNYDSRRDISLGTEERTAKADHHAQQYTTQFEGGYTFLFDQTRDLEVTPFASLGYNYLYMNKYKENGADALDLNVQGKGFNQFTQGLGMKFAYPVLAEEGTYIPSIKGAWLFDYITDKFQTTSSFAGGGPSFNTIGVTPSRNAFLVGAELAFLNRGNMTLTGNFDWMIRDQYQSYTYYLTLRFDF